jgi:hypothetical protein
MPASLGLVTGEAVILYLQSPKERIFGLLASVSPAGVVVRGLDLSVFDDWVRQEARGEESMIAPSTIFYPIHRVERVERDETQGAVSGLSDRFEREVGRSVAEAMGLLPPAGPLAS